MQYSGNGSHSAKQVYGRSSSSPLYFPCSFSELPNYTVRALPKADQETIADFFPVGARSSTAPFSTFLRYLKSSSFDVLQTVICYTFSAWLFGEVYIWSSAPSVKLSMVDSGKCVSQLIVVLAGSDVLLDHTNVRD